MTVWDFPERKHARKEQAQGSQTAHAEHAELICDIHDSPFHISAFLNLGLDLYILSTLKKKVEFLPLTPRKLIKSMVHLIIYQWIKEFRESCTYSIFVQKDFKNVFISWSHFQPSLEGGWQWAAGHLKARLGRGELLPVKVCADLASGSHM